MCIGVGRDNQWVIGTYEQMVFFFVKGTGEPRHTLETSKKDHGAGWV